ncbi:MAG: hypothetical protein R8K50_06575 [Mariprofundus sp.]
MKQLCYITILALFFCISPAHAAGGLSVDSQFDVTGDGLVDASDWPRMNEDARRAYADASVRILGEDPDARLEGEITRGQRYLQGLRSVYE